MIKNTRTASAIYLRLPQVLEKIPVSRSTWYRGMKAGIYPQSVKLGTRAAGWRIEEINCCIDALNIREI